MRRSATDAAHEDDAHVGSLHASSSSVYAATTAVAYVLPDASNADASSLDDAPWAPNPFLHPACAHACANAASARGSDAAQHDDADALVIHVKRSLNQSCI